MISQLVNRAAYLRAYYLANKERLLKRQKVRYIANKERLLEYQKDYRLANKEKLAARLIKTR